MALAPRKRRRRFEHVDEARFLTFSCYQRLPLFGNDAIKDAFIEQMRSTQQARPFHLVAWVAMPEHVHVLIHPQLPDYPVDAVLKHLKGCFANLVLRRWRDLNARALDQVIDAKGKPHFWQQGGGYDRNVFSEQPLHEKIDYIHENPVRRGLVKLAADWKWSSARFYADGRDAFGLTMASESF